MKIDGWITTWQTRSVCKVSLGKSFVGCLMDFLEAFINYLMDFNTARGWGESERGLEFFIKII